MYSLIFNPDHHQVLEDRNNRLKEAERERFTRLVARSTKANLYDRLAVSFGCILVSLGQRLQKSHGLLRSPYMPTTQKGM